MKTKIQAILQVFFFSIIGTGYCYAEFGKIADDQMIRDACELGSIALSEETPLDEALIYLTEAYNLERRSHKHGHRRLIKRILGKKGFSELKKELKAKKEKEADQAITQMGLVYLSENTYCEMLNEISSKEMSDSIKLEKDFWDMDFFNSFQTLKYVKLCPFYTIEREKSGLLSDKYAHFAGFVAISKEKEEIYVCYANRHEKGLLVFRGAVKPSWNTELSFHSCFYQGPFGESFNSLKTALAIVALEEGNEIFDSFSFIFSGYKRGAAYAEIATCFFEKDLSFERGKTVFVNPISPINPHLNLDALEEARNDTRKEEALEGAEEILNEKMVSIIDIARNKASKREEYVEEIEEGEKGLFRRMWGGICGSASAVKTGACFVGNKVKEGVKAGVERTKDKGISIAFGLITKVFKKSKVLTKVGLEEETEKILSFLEEAARGNYESEFKVQSSIALSHCFELIKLAHVEEGEDYETVLPTGLWSKIFSKKSALGNMSVTFHKMPTSISMEDFTELHQKVSSDSEESESHPGSEFEAEVFELNTFGQTREEVIVSIEEARKSDFI